MAKVKALGSAETEVLIALQAMGGVWKSTDRALWENRHWTVTLLCKLAVKGLVDEVLSEKAYSLNDAGIQTIARLGARNIHWRDV